VVFGDARMASPVTQAMEGGGTVIGPRSNKEQLA